VPLMVVAAGWLVRRQLAMRAEGGGPRPGTARPETAPSATAEPVVGAGLTVPDEVPA